MGGACAASGIGAFSAAPLAKQKRESLVLVSPSTDTRLNDASAARWIAEHLPLYALNCVLATADGIWALRYPDTHPLLILERAGGGPTGARHFDAADN